MGVSGICGAGQKFKVLMVVTVKASPLLKRGEGKTVSAWVLVAEIGNNEQVLLTYNIFISISFVFAHQAIYLLVVKQFIP